MLEWNVLCRPEPDRKIFNVFQNWVFTERYLAPDLKKFKTLCPSLKEEIRLDCANQFRCRCEYEFSMIPARYYRLSEEDIERVKNGERETEPGTYVDVYDQIMMNFDKFCDYVWKHKSEIIKQAEENKE